MADLGYGSQGARASSADVERNEYGAPTGGARRPGARTRTDSLPRRRASTDRASTRAARFTYEQAWQTLEWAYTDTLHDNFAKSATKLSEIDAWLRDIASGADLQNAFAGKPGAVEQATAFIGQATT